MNINLWFARDIHGEIITILNSNIANTYTCPICNSEVIPKALESKQVTPHFAHIDRSKCTGESFIHFWMKHGFIERGNTFTIISDESHIFTCKDFKTEVTFNLKTGVYRPDIVIETECGNEIVFEMAHKNKKKVQDYIDRWIELDKIVVEVDTPTLTGQNEVKEFKALYYKGKCFNFNKRDGGYYKTIGILKEDMKQNGKYDIELVRRLDWFWMDIDKYNNGKLDIEYMSAAIGEIMNTSYDFKSVVLRILKTSRCTLLYADYKEYLKLDDYVKFDFKTMSNDLEKHISRINLLLSNLDSRLEIKDMYSRQKIMQSYYNGSRKYPYKSREVDHYYHIVLNFRFNKRSIKKIKVTNRFMNVTDKYRYILNKCIESIPNNRKCSECSSKFELSTQEIKFFIDKELSLPKRCKDCRKKRKIINN